MQFEVKPHGKEYRFDQESYIIEVSYTRTGLRIIVSAATSMFTNIFLDVRFNNISGF